MKLPIAFLTASLALVGCSSSGPFKASYSQLAPQASWALLPLANNTDTPQAALSAESMLDHLLRQKGIASLKIYPHTLTKDSLFEPADRKVIAEALTWARGQGVRYAISGSIEEWRYKVGLDGEPAVGVTIKVIDLTSGQTVWSGAAAKSGWGHEALSSVAQKVLADAVSSLPVAESATTK